MNWLTAGVMFVNASTVCAVLLGIAGRGLIQSTAVASLVVGLIVAATSWLTTTDPRPNVPPAGSRRRYRNIATYIVAAIFALFAFRSFCWLFYALDSNFKIQNSNNLGDLAFHITLIKTFANGTPVWPDNPIYIASKLRYPAGIDLFNALLDLLHVDLQTALTWVGLTSSLATFYAFYRWGGTFGVAGFLFNGGVAGFQVLRQFDFEDYQGSPIIAWKSLPLSMFVTQRGLLYALPAALLLLWHWREKFFRRRDGESNAATSPLPFWVVVAIYGTMPLFHVHTFLALSAVLFFFAIFSAPAMRREVLTLIGAAFIPATFFIWLVSDHFHAGSMLRFHPGWVLRDPKFGEGGFLFFWFNNFGISIPLALLLVGTCVARALQQKISWRTQLPEHLAFIIPAVGIFVFGMFFATAPWEWDNLKLMVWGYFLILPFLWSELLAGWSVPVRTGILVALFGSGFVSLLGGLAANREGLDLASQATCEAVGDAVQTIPLEARFASYPTYNHPLLLNGRKVVMGYLGHLWTQGFKYDNVYAALTELMNGGQHWREIARLLGVRYIFWGDEERNAYPNSTHPWESTATVVAGDEWGRIYDLQSLEPNAPRSLGEKSPTPP